MAFLDKLGGRWNISLFHYRNHGADFGRVLAGFEVPDAEMPAFEAFLNGWAIAISANARTSRTIFSLHDNYRPAHATRR